MVDCSAVFLGLFSAITSAIAENYGSLTDRLPTGRVVVFVSSKVITVAPNNTITSLIVSFGSEPLSS